MAFIQNVERMRPIILLSVACPTLLYLSSLSHKWPDFLGGGGGGSCGIQNVCFDFLSNFFSETFLILRIQRDMITNVHTSPCKVPVILVRF